MHSRVLPPRHRRRLLSLTAAMASLPPAHAQKREKKDYIDYKFLTINAHSTKFHYRTSLRWGEQGGQVPGWGIAAGHGIQGRAVVWTMRYLVVGIIVQCYYSSLSSSSLCCEERRNSPRAFPLVLQLRGGSSDVLRDEEYEEESKFADANSSQKGDFRAMYESLFQYRIENLLKLKNSFESEVGQMRANRDIALKINSTWNRIMKEDEDADAEEVIREHRRKVIDEFEKDQPSLDETEHDAMQGIDDLLNATSLISEDPSVKQEKPEATDYIWNQESLPYGPKVGLSLHRGVLNPPGVGYTKCPVAISVKQASRDEEQTWTGKAMGDLNDFSTITSEEPKPTTDGVKLKEDFRKTLLQSRSAILQNQNLQAVLDDNHSLMEQYIRDGALYKSSFDSPFKVTAMHIAAGCGHVGAILVLLRHGACPHEVDADLATPLQYACDKNQFRAAELLLVAGAPVDHKDNHGRTALHRGNLSCIESSLNIARLLITYGADCHAKDILLDRPLHIAAIWGNTEIAGYLLKKGLSPDELNRWSLTSSMFLVIGATGRVPPDQQMSHLPERFVQECNGDVEIMGDYETIAREMNKSCSLISTNETLLEENDQSDEHTIMSSKYWKNGGVYGTKEDEGVKLNIEHSELLSFPQDPAELLPSPDPEFGLDEDSSSEMDLGDFEDPFVVDQSELES
eukprot:765576-Hanusia_phi.AAC.9